MAVWTRTTVDFDTDPQGSYLPGVRPQVMLRTTEATGVLRVGIWIERLLLTGWRMPFIPSNSVVYIDGGRATGLDYGVTRELRGWLRNYDDNLPDRDISLPHGTLTLSLDQEVGKEVAVVVEVSAMQFGHA